MPKIILMNIVTFFNLPENWLYFVGFLTGLSYQLLFNFFKKSI